MAVVDSKLIARLQSFDAPTICNAIELFEIRPRHEGYTDYRIRAAFPELPPVVGAACTAKFRSGGEPASGDLYGMAELLCRDIAEAQLPAMVVYQDLEDPPLGATFGEVMCRIYQGLGAAGLITSGAGRDLTQVREMGFPVFTGSTIASHAYCRAVEVGTPVRVGGLQVEKGDLIHADGNGVVAIPLEIAAELPEAAQAYLQCELAVLGADVNQRREPEHLLARRREMIDGIAKLRRQWSRRSTT
ncbi:MAG: RraA family protein [Pirellulales bacterium]|nr:RraA family protein [Pirellulales bacterium]